MKVKSESEVAQSCPTLSYPMDCSLTGPSVHGIFQARVLEGGAIAFSNLLLITNGKNTNGNHEGNIRLRKPSLKSGIPGKGKETNADVFK